MQANIFIAGSGGIGQAAGLILSEFDFLDAVVYFGDISQQALDRASTFVIQGCTKSAQVHTVLMPMEGSNAALDEVLATCDVILDCLPGSQAPRIAALAKKHHCHYANLTEYVNETNQVKALSKDADTAFVLQTGLAPGFINILANQLFKDFCHDFGVNQADDVKMKVGAISQHAQAPHFYAFTWSPIGVATEYLKDAEVVRNYTKINVPALSGLESIIIDGELYEDNYTSGGAADLPDAFSGKVKNLDYKTLRYSGHYDWVKEIVHAIPEGEDKIRNLEKTMLEQIPSVEDDIVVIYASITGKDNNGHLRSKEKAYKIKPSLVGRRKLRAIQTTTAAPLCQVAYMMLTKGWKGTVLQSELDSEAFLNGPFVKAIYGDYNH
ncbi:MAG: saccharopine dehydrogenase NADP-binding domain-containing protein [Chitinophagales bacterium]|nr:saccharopine dehydrogenase NADP-binding domain-containing protein [Chitinophagales bacterium]